MGNTVTYLKNINIKKSKLKYNIYLKINSNLDLDLNGPWLEF